MPEVARAALDVRVPHVLQRLSETIVGALVPPADSTFENGRLACCVVTPYFVTIVG